MRIAASPGANIGRGTVLCAHCAGGGTFTCREEPPELEPHAEGLGAAMACGARCGDAWKRGAGAFTFAGGGDQARERGSCRLALAGVAPLASDVGVPLDDVISAHGLRALAFGMQGAAATGAAAAEDPAADAEVEAAAAEEHGADGMAEDEGKDRTFRGARALAPALKGVLRACSGICIACSVHLHALELLSCRGGPSLSLMQGGPQGARLPPN